jgi:hypothetical protein
VTKEIENAPDKTKLVGFEEIKTADATGLIKMQESDNMRLMPTHIGRCELREYPSGWRSDPTVGKCKEHKEDSGGGNLPQCPCQIGQERGAGQYYWVLFLARH